MIRTWIILGIFLCILIISIGCGVFEETTTTTTTTLYNNGIPFPSKDVVFQLDDLNPSSASGAKAMSTRSRNEELVTDAYAQAGIDLGYFEGFDPVLRTFRSQTLTTLATDEFTFVSTYGAGANAIPFKGHVEYLSAEAKYIVKVWGIRSGESSYRRWLYGNLISSMEGSIIIDPYIMWTSTHDYPMTIKFSYDATQADTKICTGGATGKWSASSEVIGSTYFYCVENDSDPGNTLVIYRMYQNITNEGAGISIMNRTYGKFNRDTKQLHGRMWTNGYPSEDPDSGLLYVNTETYATVEGTVPANLDASSMDFPATPEAGFAAWPATSEFPSSPSF